MANIWDLVVRVMGSSAQFREDIAQDKATLDDLLMTIHDKDLSINVNAQEADAKLDLFKLRLDEIHDVATRIRVDDAVAKEKVDSFIVKLDEVRNATAKIDISDADAEAKIEKLKIQIDELKVKHATIPIDIEDGSAFEKIEAIRMDLDTLHDKEIDVTVDKNGNMNRFAQDTQQATSGMQYLGYTLMSLGPILSPAILGLVGATGGLASAFTAGAAGVVGFGAVAKPILTDVFTAQKNIQAAQQAISNATTYQQWLVATEQMKAATQGLNAEQAQSVRQLTQFQTFWQGFTQSFKTPVLYAFTQTLKAAQTILTDMRPTITAAGNAIGELLTEMNANLGGSQMKAFFDYLGKEAGPMILDFGRSFGNVFLGMGSLMKAFAPLANSMGDGWVNMTARFAEWSSTLDQNKGFQNFLGYVQQTGPQVLHLLGELTGLIKNVLVAMAPAGGVILPLVNGLLQLVNSILKGVPALGHLGTAIMVGVGSMKLLGPVITGVLRVLKLFGVGAAAAGEEAGAGILALSGPIGWIVGAVIAAAILIITNWKQVKAVSLEVWGSIMDVVRQVWAFIGPTIMSAVNQIAAFWRSIWPELLQVFTFVWNVMKAYLTPIFALWKAEFTLIFSVLKAMWGPFWHMLLDVLKFVWDAIRGIVQTSFDIITGLFKVVLDILTGHWGKAWSDMKNTLGNVWKDVIGMFTNMENDALQFGENFVKMIANGIMAGAHYVEDAAKSVAGKIKSFLGFGSPTEEGPGATSDKWMPNMMNMITAGIHAGIPKVHAALNQVIIPPNSAAMMNGGGFAASLGGATIHAHAHIYGNVYSTDDINTAVQQGVRKGIDKFVGSTRVIGRASGISN